MMKSVAKADSLVRKLKEHLGFRLGEAKLAEARDANGWPCLIVDGEVAVRVKGIDAVSPDIFGNSFTAFAPHVLDIGYEAAGDILTYSAVLVECSKLGAKIAIRDVADATVLAGLDAAADVELEFELRWPTKGV
jgi:hypothetical protein